ncbi:MULTISPECIES: HNH endonuclease [unclassified Sphingomonas]|uniref:HNH endonuclease n=1 Tax=unclassified Sphingomonas TaxID=196159 RepID=UPI0006FC565B|nr:MULTISPECIES: HNH endonuclease [unclassified Sphingomonas]KQX21705.1 restriction endonuclease [Sphingomonas sp. Root1294]KQY73020.1 restriction endonuclease [Sphingomonas sp. Root50]KRB88182.1 restriction endonuclease [Sphingomonas sp. Root720]
MAFGVFIHRSDSIYDDTPAERYQFPRQYLSRASACIGDWIIYYEPSKVRDTKGYFAVAKVEQVIPDPAHRDMYLALIEPGSYLDFTQPVPFSGPLGIIERGILNEDGRVSGRAQSAVRPLSPADFNHIIDLGLAEEKAVLPRLGEPAPGIAPAGPVADILHEEASPFRYEEARERVSYLSSRIVRDRIFRRLIVNAYDARCAVTGLKLVNGGGRAEVEAAHIRSVEAGGPDIVSNGLALSGTAHWMFDRGLISLSDELEILVSRQTNDRDGILNMVNRSRVAFQPKRPSDRPHPHFLAWHRENCFKQ